MQENIVVLVLLTFAYLFKLREAFVVDEEGFDEVGEEESQNLLRDFEEYIRKTKVSFLKRKIVLAIRVEIEKGHGNFQ